MSEPILGILLAALNVFVLMAPYLLLGFFLSGWLYVLVPRENVAGVLGRHRRLGPVWAALVGVPLPLCSCGVLPFARLLKDRGASPGSIVSFLLTTPQTGVDSILVSASILGWPLTFWKIGTAFASGVLGGFAANAVAPREDSATPEASACCCGGPKAKPISEPDRCGCSAAGAGGSPLAAEASCGPVEARTVPEGPPHGKLRSALHYGLVRNLGDVAGWLVWGLLAAGVISYAVPEDFFVQTLGGGWVEMLAILALSMPIYVCATGSVPIGAALAAKGLSAGAVMVFLIAGPAVSAVSIAVLGKAIGRRLLSVYLATIVALGVASGVLFNAFFPDFGRTILSAERCDHWAWWQWSCAAILGGALLFRFAQRAWTHGRTQTGTD